MCPNSTSPPTALGVLVMPVSYICPAGHHLLESTSTLRHPRLRLNPAAPPAVDRSAIHLYEDQLQCPRLGRSWREVGSYPEVQVHRVFQEQEPDPKPQRLCQSEPGGSASNPPAGSLRKGGMLQSPQPPPTAQAHRSTFFCLRTCACSLTFHGEGKGRQT